MEKRKSMLFLSVAVVAAMLLSSMAVIPTNAGTNASGSALKETSLAAPTVPGAPQNLVADFGPGFVWLWWDHPATNGASLIKTYEIYRGATSGGETLLDTIYVGATYYSDPLTFDSLWLNGLNFYNDTAAAIGSTYFYEIRAVSDAGNSAFSNEVSAMPSLTGNAPNAPSATGAGQAYAAQLNWTTATVPGGSPPARFFYLYREDYFLPFPITASFGAGGYLDEAGFLGPIVGSTSNYTVKAANTFGEGAATSLSVFVGGTGDVPSAPLNLTAFGGNNSVILSWDRPANPSSHGFESYALARSLSAGGPFTVIQNISTTGIFGYLGFAADSTVTNGVTYYYEVMAKNSFGTSPASNVANATPQAFTFPFEVTFLDAYPGNSKILLDWSGAFNATGYQIWRGTVANGETLLTTVGTDTIYFDTSAVNGNTYYYKIKPVHLSTIGPFSPEASATASTGAVPTAPLLVATPSSDGVLLYSPPVTVTNPIINWTIYRGTSPGGEGATPVDYSNFISFDMGLDWTDGNSTPDVNYYYFVRAENLFGVSPDSNEASSFASPTGDVPDPVTVISATGQSGGIQVSWDSPTYEGTAILLYYDLARNSTAGGWDDIFAGITDMVGTTSYTDHYVIPGVTYTYRVLAYDAYGQASAYSPTASASGTAAGTAPTAPQNLVATAGAGFVRLSWSAPANAGTPAFTSYDIYRSTTSGVYGSPIATVDEVTLTFNDTSVTAGTPYYYEVKARNTVGSSAASNEISGTATLPPSAPSAPLGLQAEAGAGFILLNWTAPVNAGNPAFTRYDVYRGTTSGGEGATPIGNALAGTLVFNDTTPLAGTLYYYVVKAVNTAGSSPASNEASGNATPGPQAPTAPQELDAVSGNGYVNLDWMAPANPGNPELTRYDIYRGATLATVTYLANVTAGVLTYNDTTAVNFASYVYVVKAVNSVGTSPASNSVTGAPGTTPGVPTGFTAAGQRNAIALGWTAPSGGGVANYLVFRGTTAGGEGATPIATVTGTTYLDSNLTAGTPYFYKVKANNSFGQSAFSAEQNATATPSVAPSAPQSLSATPGVNEITLTWTAPSDNGGSPITSYQVYRGTAGGAATLIATVGASVLTYTDTSVSQNTNYTYYVKAVNAIGSGAQSASQTAAPQAPAPATDNTLLYAGIAIVVIIVILILAYALMRGRKK